MALRSAGPTLLTVPDCFEAAVTAPAAAVTAAAAAVAELRGGCLGFDLITTLDFVLGSEASSASQSLKKNE